VRLRQDGLGQAEALQDFGGDGACLGIPLPQAVVLANIDSNGGKLGASVPMSRGCSSIRGGMLSSHGPEPQARLNSRFCRKMRSPDSSKSSSDTSRPVTWRYQFHTCVGLMPPKNRNLQHFRLSNQLIRFCPIMTNRGDSEAFWRWTGSSYPNSGRLTTRWKT